MEGRTLDQDMPNPSVPNDNFNANALFEAEQDSHKGTRQYQCLPLCELPEDEALALVKQLFHPEERFARSFYIYWREVLEMSEEEAWQATLDEVQMYVDQLSNNLEDQRFKTVGFIEEGRYTPVGLYGFRALVDHSAGEKLLESMKAKGILDRYPGKLAMAHSFSALNGYRSRMMMKYTFLQIALEAVNNGFDHIFFFMSDYRLGPIYQRFGLDFPSDLAFQDSQHLVGSVSLHEKSLEILRQSCEEFGLPSPV